MRKPKIVHMTSVHPATDVRIFHKECRSIAEAGFDVVLIAREGTSATCDGVRIRHVATSENRAARVFSTTSQVARAAFAERGDLYHFHDPELIPVGFLLKLFRKRVVYDVHEDLPRQILDKHWVPQLMRRPLALVAKGTEWLAGKLLDLIVAPTPEIAMRFPVDKTVLVRNYPRLELFSSLADRRARDPRRMQLVYIGAICEKRGFFEMIAAMSELSDAYELVLAGPVSPPGLFERVLSSDGWVRTRYLGVLSQDEVRDLLSTADVGLVLLHPTPSYLQAPATKLYEYMASGLPAVGPDFPGWPQVVHHANCGLLVNPLDPHELAEGVRLLFENPELAHDMGERGREYALAHCSWSTESRILIDSYQRILS